MKQRSVKSAPGEVLDVPDGVDGPEVRGVDDLERVVAPEQS
jgi:hypothetical protein